MKDYKNAILNMLLDKYESSKSFTGSNQVNQSFRIKLKKVFPEYFDHANVDEIRSINETINDLESSNLIIVKRLPNGVIDSVGLILTSLDECYKQLKRKPKSDLNNELLALLSQYSSGNDIVNVFSRNQIDRIHKNHKPEHFNGDLKEYESILKVLSAITNVEQETYIRDFSIRVLGDSKSFEKIKSSIISILNTYGDFPEKESILQDLNIIKNPGHVFVKGNAAITLSDETIDLSKLPGDIALSSALLKCIDNITVFGKAVITIENLTTFNAYNPDDAFVIYLGGYHNHLRRQFIKQIYRNNPNTPFYHYGDIDAGGFYILKHLREKTGIHFIPLNMDIGTLESNIQYTKPLTEHDVQRLNKILDEEFHDVISFMLEHNCKLEQEALD